MEGIRGLAKVFIGSAAVALIATIVIGALTVYGVIDVSLARILLFVAWGIGVIATMLSDWLCQKPRKHIIILTVTVAVVFGAALIGLDRYCVKKKAAMDAQQNHTTPQLFISQKDAKQDSSSSPTQAASKSAPHVRRVLPKPTRAASPPQMPPVQQDCGGGNCAVSVGQQGGITAGQIVVGSKTWDTVISNEKQDEMIRILQAGPHGRVRMNWLLANHDTYKASAGILFAFSNAGWINDQGSYAGSMCYAAECRGITVYANNENGDLTKMAIKALSVLQTKVGFQKSPEKNNPDDLVTILVEEP